MELLYARTLAEALTARDAGYEPIECCFGETSVVGDYCLDHHGIYSDRSPVSIAAVALAQQPGFHPIEKIVVTGKPDADINYATLVMTGQIEPHELIAESIGQLDIDPVGFDQTQHNFIRCVAYRMQAPVRRDLQAHIEALNLGKQVFSPASLSADLHNRALRYETKRERKAKDTVRLVENDVVFAESCIDSRDVWHRVHGSVVVQYKQNQGIITFSGCTPQAVQRLAFRGVHRHSVYDLFGQEGLIGFYDSLDSLFVKPGCGGRKDIGGSPQDVVVTPTQALQVYRFVQHSLQHFPFVPQRKSS